MIDILEKEIIRLFPDFLVTLNSNDKDVLNKSLKNKELNVYNITLLNNGFMFGFKKNNKNVYVVPNEIKDLYKEYINNGGLKKIDHDNACLYCFIYLLINGVIPKKILHKILIDRYNLNVTEKEICEIVLAYYYEFEEYYSLLDMNEFPLEPFDSLLEIKESNPYHVLEENELSYYFEFFNVLSKEIDEILKKSDITGEMIFNKFIIDDLPTKELLSELKLTKAKYKKLFDLMENAKNKLRYWTYNGKTRSEYEKYYWINALTFDEKPENTDLESCLSVLNLNNYHEMFENFEDDGNLLNEKILNYAKEKAREYNRLQINYFINSNHNELTDLISLDEISHGLVYFYEENDKTKCLIPEEIIDIMHNAYHKLMIIMTTFNV